MIKKNLVLIGNRPNIFSFPQVTIDTFKVDEDEKDLFISTVKIFANRAKSHLTYEMVRQNLVDNLNNFDIVRMAKYPLPVTVNETTSKIVINLNPTGHRSISSIEPRDLYSLIVYGHAMRRLVSAHYSLMDSLPVMEFMSAIFLKIFSKSYGLTGSYSKLIPELRFVVSVYVLVSFYGSTQKQAYDVAVSNSRFDMSQLQLQIDTYDLANITELVRYLNDSGTLPGLNMYKFISTLMKSFGIMNLPIIEDIVRFHCSLLVSTINGNTIVPAYIQSFNKESYEKIVSSIQRMV